MIRAVIFDMDGLLIDSEGFWEEARRTFCRDVGCTWNAADELLVKGHNSVEWAHAIQHRCGLELNEREIIDGVTGLMRNLYGEHLPLLPGAVQAVQSMADLFPVAIASSSPLALIQEAMSDAGIIDRFQVLVSADHVGRGKPAPDVFLKAAILLGVPPSACAVLEDSSAGIQAGRAADMFVIAVPNPLYPPHADALSQADLVLASLLELQPELLQRG